MKGNIKLGYETQTAKEVSGEVMSKVSSEDEEIWYCKKCDNEYRINQDGSRDVIS